MRVVALLALFWFHTAVAVAGQSAAADLVGTWSHPGGSLTDSRLTFRPDRTFDGVAGDALMAGKWKLHAGSRLELVYYSDYDRKIISRSSARHWAIIDSLSKNELRFRWFAPDLSPGFQLSSPQVFTRRRTKA